MKIVKYVGLIYLGLLNSWCSFGQIDHFETIVFADDTWSYHKGNLSPNPNWNLPDFNDSFWLQGQGSIGYGDDDDATIIEQVPSLYMRKAFTIFDLSKIESLFLHADFDDAFVAYINGIEVARQNITGNPPSNTDWASDLREAQMYQGGLPLQFNIPANEISSILQEGENVLCIQTHNFEGTVSSDLTTLYWLSAGINDDSQDYGPIPDWFETVAFESNLPIVKITTENGAYIPDEPSINAEMGIIWNGPGQGNSSAGTPNEFLGNISIERRGQTSLFFFPKNGFAIETKDELGEDKDVSFLNFPAEEDWILQGPYSDKTLLRNIVVMELAKRAGQYSSRTRLVELMINESYEGVYVMMEKIKRDSVRIDVANLKEEDIEGDELTGGYVFKIDKGEVDWFSTYNAINSNDKIKFQYVSPKRSQIMPEQEAYLQAYVDSFEIAMNNPLGNFGGKTYADFIDLKSFAEHFLMVEITQNVDGYRLSTYFHKDKESNGGKIKAGPVWDYNIALGNHVDCNADTEWGWIFYQQCGQGNPFWWQNLLGERVFNDLLQCRWSELRDGPYHTDSIYAFIDEKIELLDQGAQQRNFQRWPILNEYVWPNNSVTGSFDAEVDYLKDYLGSRLAWMDENMFGLCENQMDTTVVDTTMMDTTVTNTGFINVEVLPEMEVTPNPAQNYCKIKINAPLYKVECIIYDTRGKKVYNSILSSNGEENKIDLTDFSNGLYIISLKSPKAGILQSKRLIINK